MTSNKYFLHITSDPSNAILDKISESQERLNYVPENFPNDCCILLSDQCFYVKLLYGGTDYEPANNLTLEWQNIKSFQSPFTLLVSELAKSIHALADLLHCDGISLIAICQGNLFSVESPNDHVELYGALLRLSQWHNADITIMECDQTKCIKSTACKWTKVLDCSKDHLDKYFSSYQLWHGSMEFGSSFMPDCPVVPNLRLSFLLSQNSTGSSTSKQTKSSQIVSVNKVMRVLQVCEVSSILPYFVHSTPFIVSSSSLKCLSSNPFFKYMKSNPQSGVVVRLYYNTESVIPEKRLSSDMWNKAVLKGDVEARAMKHKATNESLYLNFVLHQRSSDNAILALALRHPSQISSHFLHDLVKLTPVTVNEEENQKVSDTLDSLPQFSATAWNKFQNSVDEIIVQKISEAKDTLPIVSEVKSSVFQQWIDEKIYLNYNDTSSHEKEIENINLDPSDWPERRFLLFTQLQDDNKNSLCGLTPPHPRKNERKAVELSNYFTKTGESKLPKASKKKKEISCLMKPSISREDFDRLSWPSIAEAKYHDTYFNNDGREQREAEWTKLVERLVLFETSTWDKEKGFYMSVGKMVSPQKQKIKKSEEALTRRSPRNQQNKLLAQTKSKRPLPNESTDNRQKKEKLKPSSQLNEQLKKKLREAVVVVLESEGIKMEDPIFKSCGPRLFNICKEFVKDAVSNKGVSKMMKQVAQAHVKQVIEFEKIRKNTKYNKSSSI